ncbi:hypothetical protein VIS19158_07470 [Vibrio scophthalmi LMG 19158]|uniref:Uncharacterized protein n=1 Tax=Vibrio scophthalmi LMG 19158 TaxID=870967 RepID=F9RJ03_9VIBR|nr:hypothetical protein VIS19158_07470 [Vibrio scophthalmi LMG 19158]
MQIQRHSQQLTTETKAIESKSFPKTTELYEVHELKKSEASTSKEHSTSARKKAFATNN